MKRGSTDEEKLEIPCIVYFLYDPRNSVVCYVGITTQNFNKRLLQHKNPVPSNKSAIAKLQRYLKQKGMTLSGKIFIETNLYWAEHYEKTWIKRLKDRRGSQIKNLQEGGTNSYGASEESKQKYRETLKKNKHKHKRPKGEDSKFAKLTEDTVLKIYKLIKEFYSNTEIIKILELDVLNTAIAGIRTGQNWAYLWERENMYFLPSLNNISKNMSTPRKMEVLKDIEEGLSIKEMKGKYKLSVTDLKRIKTKELWTRVWEIYEKYYKLNNYKPEI